MTIYNQIESGHPKAETYFAYQKDYSMLRTRILFFLAIKHMLFAYLLNIVCG